MSVIDKVYPSQVKHFVICSVYFIVHWHVLHSKLMFLVKITFTSIFKKFYNLWNTVKMELNKYKSIGLYSQCVLIHLYIKNIFISLTQCLSYSRCKLLLLTWISLYSQVFNSSFQGIIWCLEIFIISKRYLKV